MGKNIVNYAEEEKKLSDFFYDNFQDKQYINWNEEFIPKLFDIENGELTFIDENIWFFRKEFCPEEIYYLYGVKRDEDFYLRLILKASSDSNSSVIKFLRSGKILIQLKIKNNNKHIFNYLRDNFNLKVHKKHKNVFYIVLSDSISNDIKNTIVKLIENVVCDFNLTLNFLYVTDLIKNNEVILQKDKEIVLNRFKKELDEKGIITESDKDNFKNKYNKDYYNFYNSLRCDELIFKHNDQIIENERPVIFKQFIQELNNHDNIISEEGIIILKNKYDKGYFNYYESLDLNDFILKHNDKILKEEKDKVLKEFKEELTNHEGIVTEEDIANFKNKYNKPNRRFYDILEFEKLILQKNKDILLEEFENELNTYNRLITDDDKSNFKIKYSQGDWDYYTLLNFDKLILKHDEIIIENEKTRILNRFKGKYIALRDKKSIKKSINFNWNLDEDVKKHNDVYIEEQLVIDNDFFDDIMGYSLDDNQRVAVLTDEDNTQIVAGAGTGKTLTIQAKVKYLIEKQGVAPEDILCISFSNSARDDLADKLEKTIGDAPIDVRTFHSLGYSILGINGEGREVPEYEISDLINNYFKDSIGQDPSLIKDIVEFFCYYYNIVYMGMDNLKFETFKSRLTTLNEYDEYLSEYLQIDNVKKNKEYMANIKDLVVANYLFIHNIRYEYLKQAVFKSKYYDNYVSNYNEYLFSNFSQDIPDNVKMELIDELHENFASKKFTTYPNFYLPDEDVYIDLTSLKYDWDNIKDSDIKEKIVSNLKNREKINNNYKTKLLTIFDYKDDVDSLLNDIESKLIENNVDVNRVNYELLFEKLIAQDTLPEYNRFIQTVDSFINLFKGNAKNVNYNGEDISKEMFETFLKQNHEKYSNSVEKRNAFFLKIIEKIYELYTDNLKEKYIDFNDMINDAVIYLREGVYIHEYKYVIVDEYQDTSYTRYNLLKEIQNATGAKVMVVGDDWQSIYGFTGCDVNLFSQFDKYFENPEMVKINVTRRNSQQLIDTIGEFIQENKNQIPKKLLSDKTNEKPIKIFKHVSRGEEVLALIKILNRISDEKEDAHVLILGRNNYDIYEVACREIFELTQFKDNTIVDYDFKPDLNIEFRTVHKSKGLQADYVIVLNLNDQINGFPNKIVDDPVLYFVNNKQNEDIDYPEERRLFYVALTRTKNDVYLLGKYKKPSEFIEEIIDKDGVEVLDYSFSNDEIMYINQLLQKRFEVIETGVACPKCGHGIVNLIVNNDRGTSYFRCSNFCGWEGAPYHNKNSDDGTRKIAYVKYVDACPRKGCQGIRIVRKNGNDGTLFLGCTSFPKCRGHSKSLRLTDEEIDGIVLNVDLTKMNRTMFGVYYLGKYIPEDKRDDYGSEDVAFSKRILGFKNKDEISLNLFTQDLMEYISLLSNKKLENKSRIALMAVPSSKVYKNSAMKKSIDIIEETYQKGELESEFDCDKEIINCKDLLKRVKDVPTAHKGEGRATCSQHVDSMKCEKENLSNENIAYIVLDDITTTGSSMQACNELLLNSGVKSENIFNIALGATVRDDDEEI